MSYGNRIGIVGAGISGLATAYYLQELAKRDRLPIEVELIERSNRLGGVISSSRTRGLLLESGPEGWASYKPAARQLAVELGLEPELIGSNDSKRRTFVVKNRKLVAISDGMTFFGPVNPITFWRTAPLSFRGKLRASLEPFIPPSRGDLSVEDFFSRRLGQEFTEQMVAPLISAVFGSPMQSLSAPCALPEMHRIEQSSGSLWRGMRKFSKRTSSLPYLTSLKGGMASLVSALTQALNSTLTHLSIEELVLARESGGGYRARGKGFDRHYDYVVLCSPAHAAADALASISPQAGHLLRSIPYASSTLVYLAYDRSTFNHPLNGFGFVVPFHEVQLINACTWVNTKFDHRTPPELVLLRCAVHSDSRSAETDRTLAKSVTGEVETLMQLECKPVFQHVFRTANGLPRLVVGHQKKVSDIGRLLESEPHLHLAGSYMGGVGIPDCIKTGHACAEKIFSEIGTYSRGS